MSEPIVYMPDTNMFRDFVNSNANQAKLKQAAHDFWTSTSTLAALNQAEIKIPKEVEAELKVQMHTFTSTQHKNILTQILNQNVVVDFPLPIDLERELREFTNYLRDNNNFNQTVIRHPDYGLNYLQASDARILVTAYKYDGILVTHNIKDFLIYDLLFEPTEDKLYDYVNKRFVKVPSAGRTLIEQDAWFQKLKQDLINL
ncbi:DUF4411 family protein [Paenibacillus eucommiae]|uniref:Nucleic acid-binding protein n=1 Tax=Paenibacillus eucommiae TaxID=1355755 RepID=A0ABS4J4A9_9BACL|nr:DUF4411 family protein [Paenibacillus eucommiae]MBP1994673.1 putative nucleic acid-binding protein [Paenibacillus eucommiae]